MRVALSVRDGAAGWILEEGGGTVGVSPLEKAHTLVVSFRSYAVLFFRPPEGGGVCVGGRWFQRSSFCLFTCT